MGALKVYTENGWEQVQTGGTSAEIPTALPNPHKLTFSGAVSAEYDGSEPVEVVIPEGGSGGGLKLAAAVTTTENAATISVTGLSIKLPVTITVANPGESCGGGVTLTVNGIIKKSYVGGMKGTYADRPCCIGWLYPTDASMEGRWRASNSGWNVLSWTDIPEVIESIEISSAYNDGENKYFQSGTVVEIYEGVLPNVVA